MRRAGLFYQCSEECRIILSVLRGEQDYFISAGGMQDYSISAGGEQDYSISAGRRAGLFYQYSEESRTILSVLRGELSIPAAGNT